MCNYVTALSGAKSFSADTKPPDRKRSLRERCASSPPPPPPSLRERCPHATRQLPPSPSPPPPAPLRSPGLPSALTPAANFQPSPSPSPGGQSSDRPLTRTRRAQLGRTGTQSALGAVSAVSAVSALAGGGIGRRLSREVPAAAPG